MLLDELAGDWWTTETAWFSFAHPERGLGGWLYTLARPNIGTVAGGAWVWDATAHLPWEVLYSANYTALELLLDQDLHDLLGEETQAGLPFVKRHAVRLERVDAGAALRLFVKVMPVRVENGASIT